MLLHKTPIQTICLKCSKQYNGKTMIIRNLNNGVFNTVYILFLIDTIQTIRALFVEYLNLVIRVVFQGNSEIKFQLKGSLYIFRK